SSIQSVAMSYTPLIKRIDLTTALLLFELLAAATFGAPLEWTAHPGYRSAPVNPSLGGKVGFVTMEPQSTGVNFTTVIPPERHYANQIRLNGSGVTAGDVDGDGW